MEKSPKKSIYDLDESDRKSMEQFREKSSPCDWSNYKLVNKILLDEFLDLFKEVPILRNQAVCVDHSLNIGVDLSSEKRSQDQTKSKSSRYYKAPSNPKKALREAIIDNVSLINEHDNIFVKITDMINWIEKERAIDPDFPFMLDEDFVKYHKKRNEGIIFSEERIARYEQVIIENEQLRKKLGETNCIDKKTFFQSLALEIKADAEELIKLDVPLVIDALATFLGIKIIKGDKVYNPAGEEKSGYSYDSIRDHILGFFNKGMQGNTPKNPDSERNKRLLLLMKMLSKPKYKKFIEDFKKLK